MTTVEAAWARFPRPTSATSPLERRDGAGLVPARTTERIPGGVDRLLSDLRRRGGAIARINDHGRPDGRPLKERGYGRQRQVDAAVAGERAVLRGRAQRGGGVAAGGVEALALFPQ